MTDFNSLINDEYGQRVFEEYTKSNGVHDYLLFWYAIEGFKRCLNEICKRSKSNDISNNQHMISVMAKAIYNKFIRKKTDCKVYQCFSKSTRQQIYNKINKGLFDLRLFENAKTEFEIKIQEEIYPAFLKSDIYQKYADNLKITHSEPKATKLNLAKCNPYLSSVTNYHTTSTQESECRYDPNETLSVKLNDDKKTNEQKRDANPIKMQLTYNRVEGDKVIDKTGNAERTLQHLYSFGARSHLPSKPEDDPAKVRLFMQRLEKIYRDYRESKNNEILKVIENFETDGQPDPTLRNVIVSDGATIPDSQTILDQHCIRVFNSNLNTRGQNSPGTEPQNSLRRKHKQNGNQQDLNRMLKQIKRQSGKSPYSNHQSCASSSNPSTITLMYQYSSDDYPYSIKIDRTTMTLKQFKKTILKKKINLSGQKFRYFFKKKDQIENMYIMEELTDNNDLVPLCDDRVFSRIEIVPI